MAQELTPTDENFGPAMLACTALERQFVLAYMEHSTYSHAALAKEATAALGGSYSSNVSAATAGMRLFHSERVIAAVNEETSKRLRMGGPIGIAVMIGIAQNPMHKDQLKAATALADRTGFHAMSEHKVVVDDKRPETRAEMIEQIKSLGKEAGWTPQMIAMATGGAVPADAAINVVDAEFVEVEKDLTEADVAKMVEDL